MGSANKDSISIGLFVLRQSVQSFMKNGNLAHSASLAYYSLLALFPFMLLLFFVLSLFITSSEAVLSRITLLVSEFIPHLSGVLQKEVYSLAGQKGIWGILSMAAMLWASMPLMSALRETFFDIFKMQQKPSFFKTKLLDISVILLTLAVLVAVSLLSVALKGFFIQKGGGLLYGGISFAVTVVAMSVFYLAFSPVRVPFIYILLGSVAAAALWGAMRPLFSLFLSYNPNYGMAFGSLKAFFIVTVWIYYSFTVLLFGAEVIANLRRKDVLLLRRFFYEPSAPQDIRLMRKFGKTYSAGDMVFREGDAGEEMFCVMSGSVRLSKRGQTLKVMKKGDYFGEMALLIGTPRTTDAEAEEDSALVSITPGNFETLLREETKIAMLFLRELAERLKRTNEIL
ncbi:MAG: YhjD/YihY/BrkB family envelope integrity protein [Thermodesulfovibrionales bacterium]|nr:YhjD/YihY/BrkB family envelope integrity protein [Thermodesulfovibrionales bacterium]